MSHYVLTILQSTSTTPRIIYSPVFRSLMLVVGLLIPGLFTLASAQTVTILQPANNSTVSTSVRVQASVSGTNVTNTKIYLDGTKVYSVNGATVDTTISMSTGTHRIAVQAYEADGSIGKTAVYVTASSTTNSDTGGTTLTDLTVFARIEEKSEWQTCGNCGNTGASGSTATYSMTRGISSPSQDGSSAKFSIGGSYAYKNAYWYIKQTAPTAPVTYLRYEFDIYVPKASATAPQAIEFECQQRASGYVYNFAWQANYAAGVWRIFDFVNRKWISSGLSLTKFSPDTWHHVVAEYHTTGGYTVHDALTVDGVRKAVGIKQNAKYVGGTGRSFSNAFQLDLNKYATDYMVYVDGMKVSYK